MLVIVLVSNGLIGLLCLLAAWRLWRLKRRFAKAADTLLSVERAVHRVLYRAPSAIDRSQLGVRRLRQRYQKLNPQLRRAQQALVVLNLAQLVWQQRSLFALRPSLTGKLPTKR